MKTQYIARAAITVFTKPHTGEQVFIVFDTVRVTTAKALMEVVANTASQNGLGAVSTQLIPITREQHKAGVAYIQADTLKR